MLRFLGKTTESAARCGGSSTIEVCGGEEGLSTWELVNAAHSDDEDLYSYDSEETVSTADDLEPIPDEKDEDDDDDVDLDEDAPEPRGFVSPSDIIAIQAMSVSPPMNFPLEMARDYVAHGYAQEYYVDDGDLNGVDDEDDEEDVEDDYDVDDELVPWKLKGRFGKQRIVKMGVRRMGQRGGPKLKAKKVPYYDNRPGFSHGKLR